MSLFVERLNIDQCDAIVKSLQTVVPSRKFYNFANEVPNGTKEQVANYVAAVVALDHHFWRLVDNQYTPDYYIWNGKEMKGANYLWEKSKLVFGKNPDFFTPSNLEKLTVFDFNDWLADDGGTVPFADAANRYILITQYGHILSSFKGVYELYTSTKRKLSSICQALELADAYRDSPFYKKANLLSKILERRKVWKVLEKGQKIVPLDYHLMNMAVKLSLIELSDELMYKFERKMFLTSDEELAVRSACKYVYNYISSNVPVDPYLLDDLFWEASRKYCQTEPYDHENCPFKDSCQKTVVGFPVVDTVRY